MGAVITVFSLINGILLSPLPYPAPDRLVGLWHSAPGLNLLKMPQSKATYLLYSRESKAFEEIAIYRAGSTNLSGNGAAFRVPAAQVTPSFFRALRVPPLMGRTFSPDEGSSSARQVVILGHALWRNSFGGDSGIIGRSVRLDGVAHQVIGVMPEGFDFPNAGTDLWLPMAVDPSDAPLGDFSFDGIARLADEVTLSAAQSDLNRLLANLERTFPGEDSVVLTRGGFTAQVHTLRDDVVGDVGKFFWLLLGAVTLVLMIACVNVANLLIVRGEGQRREMAIQTALGAGRSSLFCRVLAESLVLGLAAGIVGLLLAYVSIRLLTSFRPVELPRLDAVAIDGWVVVFAAVVSLLTSLLFGLLPAFRASAVSDLVSELKSSGRSATSGRSRQQVRRLLIGLQIALALVLLSSTGLLVRSFLRMSQVDPGFRADRVLTLQLSLPEAQFPDDAAVARFYLSLTDRLRSIPGIVNSGGTSSLPLGGSASATGFEIEDIPRAAGAPPPIIDLEYVTNGYFRALGIPLREGRALERQDQEQRSGAVVVNEAFARRFWPDESALGKRLRPSGSPSDVWYTVVGVAGNVRNRRLIEEPAPIVYLPMLGKAKDAWVARSMTLALGTSTTPDTMVNDVRSVIWSIAPDLPISQVSTMEKVIERDKARLSFSALMFVLAALVAVGLAVVGIYGFVSYLVQQRTPELGVRMAIGASPTDIRRLILRESFLIVVMALPVGLLVALAMSRWLESLLFEINPLDPLTFALVPLILVLVMFLASLLPADRATRIDPLVALRRSE